MKLSLLLFFICFISTTNEVVAQEDSTSLDSLIHKKRAYNATKQAGYCVQIYNGNEKTALYKIEQFENIFPEIEIHRIYQVPEWKIQTGIYKTRLEADRVLNLIKKKYPGARVR
jgi:mitochondrial fission protein ELM1